jgi:hypothetical protein
METTLVQKSKCSSCDEPVEISYNVQEFEKEMRGIFNKQPLFKNEPVDALLYYFFSMPVSCESCSKEPDRQELNEDYWKNFSVSNPNG